MFPLYKTEKMVNLEWYRTFKAIYQNGTLTKAAQELMISQPNVSVQLSSLEAYIGQTLFTRFPRKMEPTEYGKLLYTQIVESIVNLERVENEFKRTVLSKHPTFRFGMPSELFYSYFSENLSLLNCHLIIKYGLANEFQDLLLTDQLDVAILTQCDIKHEQITYEPLLTESFCVVCNPSLDTSEFDSYVEKDDDEQIERWLKNKKWYAYNNNLALIRRFWRENFKKRPIIKVDAVIPDNNAILKAVSVSNGLAVSSDFIAQKAIEEGLVKVLWTGSVPSTNMLFLAYRKTSLDLHSVNEMRSFVNKCLDL